MNAAQAQATNLPSNPGPPTPPGTKDRRQPGAREALWDAPTQPGGRSRRGFGGGR